MQFADTTSNQSAIAFMMTDGGSSLAWLLSQPLFWAFTSIIFGPYIFFLGFGALRQKRQLMNVPRSTVRGAALGLVEISGRAVGPYTLVAPLSKQDCLYYRLVVVEDPQKQFSSKARQMCAPLFVDDGTGLLLIYPANAELRMKPSHQLGSLGNAMSGSEYGNDPTFVQEFTIKPGDQIFVLGTLTENRWTKPAANTSDLSRIGPGFVSQSEADLMRCEAFVCLDPTRPPGERPSHGQTFDLYPGSVLTKANGPFFISQDSERDLQAKLSWKSLLYIWGGPIATLWGLWELLIGQPGWIDSLFNR